MKERQSQIGTSLRRHKDMMNNLNYLDESVPEDSNTLSLRDFADTSAPALLRSFRKRFERLRMTSSVVAERN